MGKREAKGRAASSNPEIEVVERHGTHAHPHLARPELADRDGAPLEHLGPAVAIHHHRFGSHEGTLRTAAALVTPGPTGTERVFAPGRR
jgi:hypothetical protein